ncbi:hypothetical protein BCR44DRAFT_37072 [Catenaria anguillulae PL171]|uniref:Uncharacterized protein n=1 Tax=Catenaria anguillulae PL171 TaxID=765915 RepID=A0A1Y2HTS0_9FUNG|nr:hypothetical protein BCR44DRAFT_37072 [Catenaria anguillulae PL171]
MNKLKVLSLVKNARALQQLHVERFSALEQQGVQESIHAYVTARHGKSPRDFCFARVQQAQVGVFWPRIFLSFDVPSKKVMIAFGSWLKAHNESDQQRLSIETQSGLQELVALDDVDVIDASSVLAPAHAMPLYSNLERGGVTVSRELVMACGPSHCRSWVLNSFASREVFHLLRSPDLWYRLI